MKNKRVVSIILSLVLTMSLAGTDMGDSKVYADDTQIFGTGMVIDEDEIPAEGLSESAGDVELYKDPVIRAAASEAKYDPRETAPDSLPAVRDQETYGTCWAQSALACVEINLIKNGQADNTIDLSEFQTAYYTRYTKTDEEWADPLGGMLGDGYWYDNYSATGNFLKAGGNHSEAALTMANWKGLAQESDSNGWKYNDENASALVAAAQSGGGAFKKDKAYGDNYAHLTDYRSIPMSDREAVKTMVSGYGAVAISYCAIQRYGTGAEYYDNVYNRDTCAYYIPSDVWSNIRTTNHGITIVGWDDNYSASNFATTPEGDGAWICRNSWGADWGDGGYFYLSYYDNSIYRNGYVYAATLAASDCDNNYQYDGAQSRSTFTLDKAANVFTAKKSSETLKAVYFETGAASLKYKVSVYKDLTDTSNPESGTLMSETSGTTDYIGGYRVNLTTPVDLAQGDVFSIVVDLDTGNSKSAVYVSDYKDTDYGYNTYYNTINAGESFCMNTYTAQWEDLKDYFSNIGNVHIKAFTADNSGTSIKAVQSVTLDKTSLAMNTGGTQKLTATVLPADATYRSVYWTSANASVATVDSEGNVKAVGPGTTVITVTDYKNTKSAACTVTVTQPVTSISMSGTMSCNIGKTSQLTAAVSPANATYKNVTWSSSNTKIATVSSSGLVKGVAAGSVTITAAAGGVSVSKTFSVSEVGVSRVTINSSAGTSMYVGDTKTYSASVSPSDATYKDITWSSSNTTVATVDSKGNVKAKAAGSAYITARAKNGVSTSVYITVSKKPETGRPSGSTSTGSTGSTSSSGSSASTGSTGSSGGSTSTGSSGGSTSATTPVQTQPIYRLYCPVNGEHLYTTDANERDVLSTAYGWTYEGVGWNAPTSGEAVYRLYNSGLQNHLYTTDLNEVRTLTSINPENWHLDNNGQPLFYSGGTRPIYRLYNEGLQGMHHLTTDANEYAVLPAYEWQQEGVKLYSY